MGKVNQNQLNKDLLKEQKRIEKEIIARSKERFEEAKEDMIKEFDNHKITKAIEEGPEAESDSSDTLNGKGNLFSFIGFEIGSEPTQIVREMLEETQIDIKPKQTINRNQLEFNFNISLPSKEDLGNATPMPWAEGRSWLLGIERGISGLGHYIFHKFFRSGSRSTTGLQNKKQLQSNVTFTRTSYISEILNNFKKKLK